MDSDVILALELVVGKGQLIVNNTDKMMPYLRESRNRKVGRAMCIVLPKNVDEVSQIVSICRHNKLPIVCQGGNTGRNFGAQSYDGNSIILNMKYMNKIREFDSYNKTITVDAGCVLSDIKSYVLNHGLCFPLTLGAETKCQIGGNIATNAGGINVIKYGSMRDLTLGVEAVTASGDILNGLNSLHKNNTGYDLKSLLIGSEGTLAVITAATLKLFPKEVQVEHGFIAIDSIDNAIILLNKLQKEFTNMVSCFELIPLIAMDFLEKAGIKSPIKKKSSWYVWYQLVDTQESSGLMDRNLVFLEKLLNDKLIEDATIAQNTRMAKYFSNMRELLVDLGNQQGAVLKFDIALPISKVSKFIDHSMKLINKHYPGVMFYPFGHLGDGSLHYNIICPKLIGSDNFLYNHQTDIKKIVYDLVDAYSGTFSAEHGIGREKISEMQNYKDPVELRLMQRIKHSMDPINIMNPGVLLSNNDSSTLD